MRRKILPGCLAAAIAFTVSPQAFSNDTTSLEQRITALESALNLENSNLPLEARVAALESLLSKQNTPVTETKSAAAINNSDNSSSASRSWTESVEIFGALDVDATFNDPETGNDTSDLKVSTALLGANVLLSDQLTATASVIYEEDETDLEIDTATLNYLYKDTGFSFTVGQTYLPFGSYATALVNDPLTLEVGETRETALIANYRNGAFHTAAYLFNGDQDTDGINTLSNHGFRLAYIEEDFGFGLDRISNLADSDGLQGKNYGYSSGADVVSGMSIYGHADIGPVTLALEKLKAGDPLAGDGNNSEPEVTHVEISYERNGHTFAVAHQKTDEALFLGLPEKRISLGYSTTLSNDLKLGFELSKDEDYSVAEGGSGTSTDMATIRFSLPTE